MSGCHPRSHRIRIASLPPRPASSLPVLAPPTFVGEGGNGARALTTPRHAARAAGFLQTATWEPRRTRLAGVCARSHWTRVASPPHRTPACTGYLHALANRALTGFTDSSPRPPFPVHVLHAGFAARAAGCDCALATGLDWMTSCVLENCAVQPAPYTPPPGPPATWCVRALSPHSTRPTA